MRDRLLQFIGPAAHEAHIYTYHSFCNKVINENPEYFFLIFKKMKLASLFNGKNSLKKYYWNYRMIPGKTNHR